MRRSVISIVLSIALLVPSIAHSQSGDATWLNNMDGLEVAVGRSWMAPIVVVETLTHAELNAEGTPISEISSRSEPSSTPELSDEMQTQMLSALIYQYDSTENAEHGLELFYQAQLDQISRDPRNPATNEFSPDDLGDSAYGNEGTHEVEDFDGTTSEWAIVYILVQQDNLIYQVFGQFVPGNHIEIATDIAEQMLASEASDAEPIYDMEGQSTGGLWEKLNAVEIAMPEESTVADLEIFPPADDAVMGDSVVVPMIDLENLIAVPGIAGSWHITYAPAESGVLTATPDVIPDGVFNIELWVMEFQDSTYSTAAAISLSTTLTEPLGIVSTEGGGFGTEEQQSISMINSGFVQDRSIPEGDAAVVVVAQGSTLYAARVYANGPAPTPLARDLVDTMIAAEVGDAPESVDGTSATGGMWELLPQPGDEMLHGLEPVNVRHDDPALEPVSTPVG